MAATTKTTTSFPVPKDTILYMAGQLQLTYDETKALIQNILQDTITWTVREVEGWINEFVPKRTGQLRDNLIRNLQSSFVSGGLTIKLVLKTFIDYAAKVNAMSNAQVQHDNTWREHDGSWASAYYYGYHGHILLNDPNAVGGFFQKMQDFAKQRIFINLAKAKGRHLGYVFYNKKKGTYFYKPSSGSYLVM